MIARKQDVIFFLPLISVCFLVYLCLQRYYEELLFVQVLRNIVAADDTPTAIFVRHWRCENAIDCWATILIGLFILLPLHCVTFLSQVAFRKIEQQSTNNDERSFSSTPTNVLMQYIIYRSSCLTTLLLHMLGPYIFE